MSVSQRLAVLGSPIAHSKSPRLHRAAYAALGLDWSYEARETTSDELSGFLDSRTEEWRGLSLTMPLKRDVLPLLHTLDEEARVTGAANTVLFDHTGASRKLHGFNTDVYGITESFRLAGVDRLSAVQILGTGATAASVLVAVSRLGAETVLVSARTPSHAAPLRELGAGLGVEVMVQSLDAQPLIRPDAVVSTIPGNADAGVDFPVAVRAGSTFFGVAYDPWPTALASSWLEAGGRVISGAEMLLHQAVMQLRIFVSADPQRVLPNEEAVVAAMRASVEPA